MPRKFLANPKDYDARANIMWASSMALAGFQFVLGKPGFAFPLHGMGHELSSKYDMTHGVTLASSLHPGCAHHAHGLNTCLCLRDLPCHGGITGEDDETRRRCLAETF
jgi:alcohol dehydrogenase YqhD (iron-dependent ADH family)